MKYAVIKHNEPPTIVETDKISFEEMQEIVGGDVERYPVPAVTPKADMYFNEYGRMKNLPFNALATVIAGQQVLGDVFLTGYNMRTLPEKWIRYLEDDEWIAYGSSYKD